MRVLAARKSRTYPMEGEGDELPKRSAEKKGEIRSTGANVEGDADPREVKESKNAGCRITVDLTRKEARGEWRGASALRASKIGTGLARLAEEARPCSRRPRIREGNRPCAIFSKNGISMVAQRSTNESQRHWNRIPEGNGVDGLVVKNQISKRQRRLVEGRGGLLGKEDSRGGAHLRIRPTGRWKETSKSVPRDVCQRETSRREGWSREGDCFHGKKSNDKERGKRAETTRKGMSLTGVKGNQVCNDSSEPAKHRQRRPQGGPLIHKRRDNAVEEEMGIACGRKNQSATTPEVCARNLGTCRLDLSLKVVIQEKDARKRKASKSAAIS